MSEKYGEPFHVTESDGVPSRVNNLSGVYYAVNDGPTPIAACGLAYEAQYIADSLNACKNLTADEKKAMRNIFNTCANRSESEIKAAFALYDNREKVVEQIKIIYDAVYYGGSVPNIEAAHTAALALLQAEKEGGNG